METAENPMPALAPAPMTKAERAELGSLIRKRERVMKAQATARSAALLAEFEAQSAKMHHWDDDAVWAEARLAAREAVVAARLKIAERSRELGIPVEFAPTVSFSWYERGHNAVSERRAELRMAAKRKIEALEAEARTKIEQMSLDAQEAVVASGLQSDAAKEFLSAMSKVEALMPPVDVCEVQSLIESRAEARRKRMALLTDESDMAMN